MKVSFWNQIVPSRNQIVLSLFCCCKFYVSMFSKIFHSLSKNWVFYQPEKNFLKVIFTFSLISVFISIYGFSHVFWLNLITLCTLFNTGPWIKACFKFFMRTTYSVLSCNLATSFYTFSSFILSDKKWQIVLGFT